MSTRAALWLLPAGFIVHDAEELLTMAGWIARHRIDLERWSSQHPLLRQLVENVPSSNTEIAVAMALELALLTAVTAIASRDVGKRRPLLVYAAALGVFVVHAGAHVLQALVVGGYVPGVVTAATVIPGVGMLSYGILLRRGLLSIKAAVAAAIVGIVVFAPLFMLLVQLARFVDQLL
jgi:hypothetical protein